MRAVSDFMIDAEDKPEFYSSFKEPSESILEQVCWGVFKVRRGNRCVLTEHWVNQMTEPWVRNMKCAES